MKPEKLAMTISAPAHKGGVSVETVRYYHRRGLLPVPAQPVGQGDRWGFFGFQCL